LVLEAGVSAEDVLQQGSSSLASFKRPRRFVVVETLQASGSKLSRRRLREELGPRLSRMSYGRGTDK
jgi:hypothetical protein